MEFNKVSWFVTGVVCGAVAIAGVVLVANDGSLSPDMAQAECEQNVRAQVDQRVIEVLHNIDRVCQKLDKVFVVPEQATSSSGSSSKQATLKSDLQTVRNQLELYKMQHQGQWPTSSVVDQLTKKTNVSGQWQGQAGASGEFNFGPYLQKIPTNCFTGKSSVQTGTGSAGGGNCGWYYNTSTGSFSADSDSHTSW